MRLSLIMTLMILSFSETAYASCGDGCAVCEERNIFSICEKCESGYALVGTGCSKCSWPCLTCTLLVAHLVHHLMSISMEVAQPNVNSHVRVAGFF